MPTSRSSSLSLVLIAAAALVGLGWLARTLFQHDVKTEPTTPKVTAPAVVPKEEPKTAPAVAPPTEAVREPVRVRPENGVVSPDVEPGDPGQIRGRVVTPD